jgi:hypothetical protein
MPPAARMGISPAESERTAAERSHRHLPFLPAITVARGQYCRGGTIVNQRPRRREVRDPFLVLDGDRIEVVVFERVALSIYAFDHAKGGLR